MKYIKVLISLIIIVVTIVSCSTPIKEYNQKIESKSIKEKINQVQKIQINQLIDNFKDSFINEDNNNYENFDEKFTTLDYNSTISKISDYKNMVNELLIEVSSIQSNDSSVNNLNAKLIEGIKIYETLGNNGETYLLSFREVYRYLFEIEKSYNKALNLALSGNPTSISFSSELSNILSEYETELEIFDINIIEEKLKEENLDVIWFEEKINQIEEVNSKIENIEVKEESDKESKEIIINILLNVKSLFQYLIDNKSDIEWINKYETFTDYSNDLINEAKSLLDDWEINLKDK